jgi:LuxR family maltose regulon positive regulatory protein
MHLVIATREDPQLPLARLRARGHLTASEAAKFLNQVMGLSLSAEDIAALERRTECGHSPLDRCGPCDRLHPTGFH